MLFVPTVLGFAALTCAFTSQGLGLRGAPPKADPSFTEYYLQQADEATRNYTADIKVYRGNSTDIDNDDENVHEYVFGAGDSAEGPHLDGAYSKKDAMTICKYINTTLSKDNEKFLKTAVANKKKFIRYGYNGTLLSNLDDLRTQYSWAIGYIIGGCYYGGDAACNDAANIIDGQYASAINALSS